MGHGHHHHGESISNYFTEQLLTILVCGLFGFVAVMLYQTGMLKDVLVPKFHLWVLAGGGVLLLLVALRAVAVWKEAGEIKSQMTAAGQGPECGINHVHGPECDHDPNIGGAHDHDHEHSHDMSWTFARMLVLVFPVMLYFLGLPSGGYSKEEIERRLGKDPTITTASLKEMAADPETVELKEKARPGERFLKTKTGLEIRETTTKPGAEPMYTLVTGEGTRMKFNHLNDMAYDEAKRKMYEGETVIVEGRVRRITDKEFTLFRMKMTCCAPDQVALKVRIFVPQALVGFDDHSWVKVKGQLQFFKVTDGKGVTHYVPSLMVADITDVTEGDPRNEHEQ
jgi:hypothetical protein